MNNIKSYEQFITFAQNFLIEVDYSSVIVDRETAEDIMKFFNSSRVFTIEVSIDEEDGICLITRVGNEIYKEYPFNNDGEMLPIESDRVIVLKSCLCDDEIEKIDSRILIVIDDIEEDECNGNCDCCGSCDEDYAEQEIDITDEEAIDEVIEELTQELLERLSEEDSCPHCSIVELMREAYEIGKQDGLYEAKESIEKLCYGE